MVVVTRDLSPGIIRMKADKENEIKSVKHFVLGTIFIFICNLIYLGKFFSFA